MKNFCLRDKKSLTNVLNKCIHVFKVIHKEVKSMADTTMRIPKELIEKYEKLNFGRINTVKAKFSEFAKATLEKEILILEKETAVLKKSA